MNTTFEKFTGFFSGVGSELLAQLDRNFAKLSVSDTPMAVTSSYTFQNYDKVNSLQVNATSGALTIYLPATPGGNRRRTVIKTDSSGNAVTVSGNGSLINGASTSVLAAQYDRITVEPTGTGWLRVD